MGTRRVLVTGASGFLGSALCAALGRDASVERVYAVARGAESAPDERTSLIRANVATPGWTAVLPAEVDAVVHLAQSRRYREFPAGAEDMFRVNTASTFELLEWARSRGVSQFVLASTGNVYRPQRGPLREDAPCEPVGFYAASKLAAEHLVRPYGALMGVTVVRIFGAYGPGQTGMLIPTMAQRVIDGTEILLAGGAGLHMTPVYVTDCVDAVVRAVAGPERGLRIFNVAGAEVVDLGDVIRRIERLTGRTANVTATDGEPASLVGDASALRDALGWAPVVDLDRGLEAVIRADRLTD